MSTRRKQYSAPALEKGLDILELLAEVPEGLNISELANRQGRTVGEVFRMMAVLEQRGYIQLREDSDAYSITLKMFELSHRSPPVARLNAAAMPVMKSLSYEVNQSCHLVIYYEGRGHVVAQQDAPTERILSVRLGAEAPLLDTCSGHILLAFASDAERANMVKKIPKHQRKPKADELSRLVERVAGQGNEVIKSAQVQGVKDIGYPLFDHAGYVVAALVVPYVIYLDDDKPTPLKQTLRVVEAAAAKISASLGYLHKHSP